jgi:C terminal of Calcineurin-like phosphoesterase/Calcineurin-like phosphoesterase/N terminal of Calcineurin-like phosphoesterase
MLALWIHLVVVHFAIVGAALGLGLSLWAWRARGRVPWTAICLLCTAIAGLAAIAYESGAPTRSFLEASGAIAEEAAEEHARVALVFYLSALSLGLLSLQTLLSGTIREGIAAWRRGLFFVVGLTLVLSGLVTAHRGGEIRRPELRGVESSESARGFVYLDVNRNRHREPDEQGLSEVAVSNGREVVLTDTRGYWRLPIRPRDTIFLSQPSGFVVPAGPDHRPTFYRQYFPDGSPADLDFPGVEPTGPLPTSMDFPLWASANSDTFSVLCLADTQSRTEQEFDFLRDDVLAELRQVETRSALICGDLLYDDLDLGPRLQQLMATLDRPWWPIAGNHELNLSTNEDEFSLESYQRLFGPPNYSWNSGRTHFVAMDDVLYEGVDEATGRALYRGAVSAQQLAWLEADLAVVPDDWLVVLCVHIPLRSELDPEDPAQNVLGATRLLKLLSSRAHRLVLAGHLHHNEQLYLEVDRSLAEEGGVHQITLPAACGSWWSGQVDERGIPEAMQRGGSPNGSVELLIQGNGYTTRFLPASEPNEAPLHWSVEERAGKGLAVVNYYEGGPRSTVRVDWGDGVLREAESFRGKDPFVERRFASQRNTIADWIQAVPTSHLWSLTLPPAFIEPHDGLRFVVTDEYGRTFQYSVSGSSE